MGRPLPPTPGPVDEGREFEAVGEGSSKKPSEVHPSIDGVVEDEDPVVPGLLRESAEEVDSGVGPADEGVGPIAEEEVGGATEVEVVQ